MSPTPADIVVLYFMTKLGIKFPLEYLLGDHPSWGSSIASIASYELDFNVASSRGVPFCQLQQLKHLHLGFTKAYIPFLSFMFHSFLHHCIGDNLWYTCCGFSVSAVPTGVLLKVEFAQSVQSDWKQGVVIHHNQSTHTFKSITVVHRFAIEHSVFLNS